MTTFLQLSPHFSVEMPPLVGAERDAAIQAVSCSMIAAVPLLMRWPETAHLAAGWTAPTPKPETVYGLRPAHGWISAYPVFAALWCQPESPALEPLGRVCQAALLAGCLLLAEMRSSANEFESAILGAGLSTRHILCGNAFSLVFQRLPNAHDLLDVHDLLRDAEDMIDERDQGRIRALPALLRYALDHDRNPPDRRSGLFLRRVFRSRDRRMADGSVDVSVMEESRHARATEGGAPLVEYAGRQLAMIAQDARAAGTTTRRQAYWRAAHQARAIRARNQGLVSDMDRLQLVDVLALRQMCVDLLSDDELFIDKELLGPVALCISLLTGLHVAQIPVLRFELPAPGQTTSGTVRPRLLVQAQHLVLPAPDLPDAYIPAAEEQSRYRQARRYLCLPAPDNPFFELVSRFFYEEEHAAEHLRYQKILQMDAQDTCSELNARYNVRLTTGRTARFLFDQARSLSGDWAEAAYFRYGEFVDARHYYYAPQHTRLARLYARIWRGVASAAGAADAPAGQAQPPPVFVPTYVGCAACPTTASVQQMVQTQIRICRKAQVGRPGRLRTCRRHNALALYTWLMLTWMTGIRPVNESIELASFDPHSAMLFVADKETDAYCASRLVWIPSLGRRQIEKYLESAKRVSEEFGRDYPHELFFVQASGKRMPMTMSAIRRGLRAYPFRLNAQRHFLRTELRERGVPAQSVDALLGHGGNGHEPYARHSAFSGGQMARELQGPLQELIQTCGWVTLPGGRA